MPLGGYVKMVGESPGEEISPEDEERSFSHKSVQKRMAIVFAGPFFNILFTIVVFFFMFLIAGLPHLTSQVGSVQEGYPAVKAGIKAGDRVISVNGMKVNTWEELSEDIRKSGGGPVVLQIERDGKVFPITVTPKVSQIKNIFGEPSEVPMIGIGASSEQFTERMGPFKAAWEGVVQTYNIVELTVLTVVKLIERKVSVKTVGGPIMIAQMAGQQAREGVANLVFLMALISVNLAILNLLPIPVLDGGHLFFFVLEFILGKPVNLKTREIAQQVGMFILIAFMIFILYNDVTRILFQ